MSSDIEYKYFVVYWTRMEGFLFQSVPNAAAAMASEGHSGFQSWFSLEVPNVPE